MNNPNSAKKLQIDKKAIAMLSMQTTAQLPGGQQNGLPTVSISIALCSILNTCITQRGTECVPD